MSEQRWAVLGTETGNEWLVAHPGDVCHGSDGRLECWAVHSQHDTWAEAMQEADRMARTVTVTLPRVGRQSQIPIPDDYGNDRPISVSNHESFISVAFTTHGLKQDIAIHPEEAEPLALALLAHARGRA